MSPLWKKSLLGLALLALVCALTAEYWANALANAVIHQVVLPLTRLIADILT